MKVDRVTCVLDPYHVANPNTVAQQMEGAVLMGMTAALWGEITIKNGAPVESNFNTYRMARMRLGFDTRFRRRWRQQQLTLAHAEVD